MQTNVEEINLAKDVGDYYADPLGYVMYAYPWDTNESLQLVKLPKPWSEKYKQVYGPDQWACELLERIGQEVKQRKFDGKHAVDPIRIAYVSGHGPGKSTLTGWLVDWITSTRPYSQGTVTANTATQLATKTWAQIARWKRLSITSRWFDISTGKGNLKLCHKEFRDSWFCSGQTCKRENSEAFAGQHAANSTSYYVFDEGSAIDDIIWEVSEGGLTDGEPMMFVFGNGTRNNGKFYNCFNDSKVRDRWITKRIDSREAQITNKKQIQEWIDDYGIDHDFVRVRVLGLFPNQSVSQLIGRGLVVEAHDRKYGVADYSFAPVIIGVDPAWQGDDRSVIVLRQGLHSKILGKYLKMDNIKLAEMVNQFWDHYKADACFIDMGWGAGVIDYLRRIGKNPLPVSFGSQFPSTSEYVNKRTEIWCKMKQWLVDGGQIDKDEGLIEDLVAPELHFQLNTGRKILEPKEAIKKRVGFSPDIAEALALTFSTEVHKASPYDKYDTSNRTKAKTEESLDDLL
jgi:hypothetical protein